MNKIIIFFIFNNYKSIFFKNKTYFLINYFKKYNYQINIINLGNYLIIKNINYNLFNKNELYVFDEMVYAHFLKYYVKTNDKNILKILNNINYLCFFSEIFKNNYLQTIGNNNFNIKFSYIFFKNCRKIILNDSNNIKLLNKLKINNNILYFPINNFNYREYKYKKTEKNIDIIFYGSLNKNYFYRNKFILNLIKYQKK